MRLQAVGAHDTSNMRMCHSSIRTIAEYPDWTRRQKPLPTRILEIFNILGYTIRFAADNRAICGCASSVAGES